MAARKKRDVERSYTRTQFVRKLRRLADALEQQRPFVIAIAGERLRVPSDAVFNIEHERAGGSNGAQEVEFQLRWPASR